MADFAVHPAQTARRAGARQEDAASRSLAAARRYAAALLLVLVATALAFGLRDFVGAPNLTLLYVLPVVICGAAFGWGPSILAVIAGVLAFDFFFTEPFYSLQIYSPADMAAAGLLVVIAGIVTSVAAVSRRRALQAARATEQATALQGLAHALIESRPPAEILQAAAAALHQIFRAPTVIFTEDGGVLRQAAAAGDPKVGKADEEAALGAMADHIHTRAETYPFDRSEFEFWPVTTPQGRRSVIGLDFTHGAEERPASPERFVEVVAAYLSVGLQARGPRPISRPPGGSPRRP